VSAAPDEYAYLAAGLVQGGGLRADLEPHARAVARRWLAEALDPAPIELAAEVLARWAAELRQARLDAAELQSGLAFLGLAPAVKAWLACAAGAGLGATEGAALALHLLDIAERLALCLFLPELPAMCAKAERGAGAARQTGLARHLKG